MNQYTMKQETYTPKHLWHDCNGRATPLYWALTEGRFGVLYRRN